MKTFLHKLGAFAVSGSLLLASMVPAFASVPNVTDPKDNLDSSVISIGELENLLSIYSIPHVKPSPVTFVKIFDTDDQLIFSTKISKAEFPKDLRLQRLLDQSYFLTEVDDTKLYILKK